LECWFDHEKLHVYREAIAFCAWWHETARQSRLIPTLKDQLDRASTSIPLNIAEGNGKLSPKDRCRYLQTAVGSALECAACLDVIQARRGIQTEQVVQGKQKLRTIASMLIGLINSTQDRIQEEPASYSTDLAIET
jgi:four helix bundle protein